MAPVSPLTRLLLRAWFRAQVLVHGGAALLLALVIATESAALPIAALLDRLRAEVPHTWALLSPALTLAAMALSVARLRGTGELLAFATLGVSFGRVASSSLWATLPLAALVWVVGRATDPAVEVARAPGAWVVRGVVLLDPVTTVTPELANVSWGAPLDWPGTAWLLVLAGFVGAGLGSRAAGRWVLVAAAVFVVVDLLRRGSDPAGGLLWLAGASAGVAALGWWTTARRGRAPGSPARS